MTVFIVVIPIGETQAASRRGKVKRTTLDAAYLTDPAAGTDDA